MEVCGLVQVSLGKELYPIFFGIFLTLRSPLLGVIHAMMVTDDEGGKTKHGQESAE